jgi:hypothetical protein
LNHGSTVIVLLPKDAAVLYMQLALESPARLGQVLTSALLGEGLRKRRKSRRSWIAAYAAPAEQVHQR